MYLLFTVVDRLALLMHRLSGLLLILMMATVVADVAARALFSVSEGQLDLTFIGGIELVSFGLLFCIVFSLPHCVDKGQVVVDLFTQNMSAPTEQVVSGLYTLGFALLGLAMSWRFYHAYEHALLTMEVTQDLLFPVCYLYLVASVATLTLGVRSLRVSAESLIRYLTGRSITETSAECSTAIKGDAS